jgi:hypothetical protein
VKNKEKTFPTKLIKYNKWWIDSKKALEFSLNDLNRKKKNISNHFNDPSPKNIDGDTWYFKIE